MASSAVDLGRTPAALIAEDAALLDGLARQPLSDDALTHACRLWKKTPQLAFKRLRWPCCYWPVRSFNSMANNVITTKEINKQLELTESQLKSSASALKSTISQLKSSASVLESTISGLKSSASALESTASDLQRAASSLASRAKRRRMKRSL